jgi:hypothetical protein
MAEKAQKLQAFVWEGKDRKGNKSKGEVSGTNLALVKAQLRKQGIIPDKVKKKPKPLFGKSRKITPFDIAMLTRQMATMMKAGVPLVQSFDIVMDGLENEGLRDLLAAIRNDVASGVSFAGSLRRHPKYFDDLYCNLVDSGEKAGALEQMLDRIAMYLEKNRDTQEKSKESNDLPNSGNSCCVNRDRYFACKSRSTVRSAFPRLRCRSAGVHTIYHSNIRVDATMVVHRSAGNSRGNFCLQRGSTKVSEVLRFRGQVSS